MAAFPSTRTFWTSSGATVEGSETSRRSASNRTMRRLPSCVTVCGVAGATSNVSRATGPCMSIRPAMRGTRTSPTITSRVGFRRSIRVPATGASARFTKSTGTNQARPSRAGGAGSETSRPATEASSCPGESTMVCPRIAIVNPPAIVSSRAVKPKRRARSSTANISWLLIVRTGSGRRPSRDRTV
jgi:hypothetical protein